MSREGYLKNTHPNFINSDNKEWDLWAQAADVSIHLNTSIYDDIQDIEILRNKLWNLREMLEMVKSVTLKSEYKKPTPPKMPEPSKPAILNQGGF